MNDIDDRNGIKASGINNGDENKQKKIPYSRPTLRIYGTVSKLTSGSGGTDVDGGGAMTQMAPSDKRIKQDIVKVGAHWLGIGLYLFNYKPEYREKYGKGRQFGVMADEVETVMPSAVFKHSDGYKMVNYALLGISRVY